jgi:hypothetical protein
MDCFDSCYGRHQYLTAPSKPAQAALAPYRETSMRFNKLDLNLLVALDAADRTQHQPRRREDQPEPVSHEQCLARLRDTSMTNC